MIAPSVLFLRWLVAICRKMRCPLRRLSPVVGETDTNANTALRVYDVSYIWWLQCPYVCTS